MSDTKKDGGPAFPIPEAQVSGMSLLDWFAGKALTGLLADPQLNMSPEDIATLAYRFGAAMVAESNLCKAEGSDK